MRIALDTNIFVSALITKGTPPDQLYQAWLRNDIDLVTSVEQIDEITDVLARPKFRGLVDPDEAARMIFAIHLRAIVVADMDVSRRSPDPKDDMILATAVAGQAELLVTGDKRDLLALQTVDGIPICTPRDALQIAIPARES